MRDLLRQAVLAIMVGLTMLAGAGVGLADPPAEVEMPGILTAVATCDFGKASVTVWIDDNRDDPIAVRLDRLHPDTATRTRNTELDEDRGLHKVVFEPVTIGDYNVHIDGRDGVADDLTVVVKDCKDVKPRDDPLTIEVECKAGWGIATFQVANPDTDKVVQYTLAVDVISEENIELSKGLFLRVTLNALDDGTYTAELTGDVEASKDFVVKCAAGNAPKLDVSTEACGGASAQVGVAVRNPNRATVDYRVTLKDVTKTVSVPGGQRGTVTFPGVPAGEYPVRATGADQTESASVARVECQSSTAPSSPTTTTTTTPAPQGRSGSGLANTGASVAGLVGIGGLVLLLGAALLIVGRRRRAHQD
jgi:LPXTG-motif cell wall-anchored protein